MSTESKGKHRLTDMSIDPSKLKVKPKESEVTPEKEGAKDNKAPRLLKERKDPSRRISHHKGHGKQKPYVCVKKGDEVQRVARATVEEKYISAGWSYCPRSEWRKVRDGVTPVAPVAKKSKKSKVTEETSEA